MGGGRGIDSDAVSGLWRVRYGMNLKNITFPGRLAATLVSFLRSKIPNKDTFNRVSRQFI